MAENRIKGLGKQIVTERELMQRIQATLPAGQTLKRLEDGPEPGSPGEGSKIANGLFDEETGCWYPACPLGWHFIMSDKRQPFHPFDHNWDDTSVVLADLDLETVGRAKGVLGENEILEPDPRKKIPWSTWAVLHPEKCFQSEEDRADEEEFRREFPEDDLRNLN